MEDLFESLPHGGIVAVAAGEFVFPEREPLLFLAEIKGSLIQNGKVGAGQFNQVERDSELFEFDFFVLFLDGAGPG